MNFSYFSLSLAHKKYIAWQAFEPPLDMSQDVDIFEDSHLENSQNDHFFLGERNVCSCQSTSTSGSLCFTKYDQACSGEGSNAICKSPKGANTNEVF
jgi:carnosine N-methyltransferase